MAKKISINVLPADVLKSTLGQISKLVSTVLEGTFGPYGQNTLIQTVDTVYSTKDGWNVMQNLRITDEAGESAIAANAMKKLIQDVAQSVVLNAGDGTTTSILAATRLNEHLTNMLKDNPMDVRQIENMLRSCTAEIIDELQKRAITINDENMADIIYQIALISTNWDSEIARLISDIHVKTRNPIIKVEDSGTLDTYADYIEGFDLVGTLLFKNYYATTPSKGLYEGKNPTILVFGSTMHGKQLIPLTLIGQLYASQKKDLVILSPTYDMDFLNGLQAQNSALVKMGKEPVNLIPFKYYAKTQVDKDCVEDFTTLIGARFITDQVDEIVNLCNDILEFTKLSPEDKETWIGTKGYNPMETAIGVIEDLAGTCENLEITEKHILASGLSNMNEEVFIKRKETLENELFKEYKKSNAESTLTDGIRLKRLRLGKMECNMGVIKLGGFGAANLKARRDAIDDATRACEVAYKDGYIVDGGIAIPAAVMNLMTDELEKTDPMKYEYFNLFLKAFSDVAAVLYNNRYHDLDKSYAIVDNCIRTDTCYNLIEEKYDTSLITPVNVCKEVLNGCLRLVLVNTTSNQFVFKSEDELIREIQAGTSDND